MREDWGARLISCAERELETLTVGCCACPFGFFIVSALVQGHSFCSNRTETSGWMGIGVQEVKCISIFFFQVTFLISKLSLSATFVSLWKLLGYSVLSKTLSPNFKQQTCSFSPIWWFSCLAKQFSWSHLKGYSWGGGSKMALPPCLGPWLSLSRSAYFVYMSVARR